MIIYTNELVHLRKRFSGKLVYVNDGVHLNVIVNVRLESLTDKGVCGHRTTSQVSSKRGLIFKHSILSHKTLPLENAFYF